MVLKGKVMNKQNRWRWFIFLSGLVVQAFGINLNTKTGFGVSPIAGIAYTVTGVTGISFGITTFVMYLIFIFLQFVILGRNFKPVQLLQIVVALISSYFVNLFNIVVPDLISMPSRVIGLVLAIVITAMGIIMTVPMKLIPNPADALTNAMATKMKGNLGLAKNIFDFSCMSVSVVIALLSVHHLIGIGIGTIMSMLFTGRAVALLEPVRRKLVQVAGTRN